MTADVDWHHLVWFNGHIPKHAFISWMLCRNRLNTKSRLQGWGVVDDDRRMFCSTGVETADHLFFECAYSAYFWTRIQEACLIYRSTYAWQTESQWLIHHLKRNTFSLVIMKLALGAVVYHPWNEKKLSNFLQQSEGSRYTHYKKKGH